MTRNKNLKILYAGAFDYLKNIIGQGILFPVCDHPADSIPAEDIKDHVKVKICPFGRTF
jgi:hypothetical protein